MNELNMYYDDGERGYASVLYFTGRWRVQHTNDLFLEIRFEKRFGVIKRFLKWIFELDGDVKVTWPTRRFVSEHTLYIDVIGPIQDCHSNFYD